MLRGDIVKDDSGSYAGFTERGSTASQMTAAKSLQDYLIVQDKEPTQYLLTPQKKREDAPKMAPNSKVRMS